MVYIIKRKVTYCLLLIIVIVGLLIKLSSIQLFALNETKGDNDKKEVIAINNANTNVSNWSIYGSGKLEDTRKGLKLSSESNENVFAISDVQSEAFNYASDVQILDKSAKVALLFGASENGRDSYSVQLVPEQGVIQLRNVEKGNKLVEEVEVNIKEDNIYNLRVKVAEETIKVYWENQYNPVIDTDMSLDDNQYVGLSVSNGSALFQHVVISEFSTNLDSILVEQGDWQPNINGLKGYAEDDEIAEKIYDDKMTNFVLEGNISFKEGENEAGLTFRMNEDGTEGYQVILNKHEAAIEVRIQKADGTILGTSTQSFPSLNGTKHHLEIIVQEEQVTLYLDGYADPAIEIIDNSYSEGFIGLIALTGTAYFQDVYAVPTNEYYKENYRPDYHYTPARGSVSDPNGLVYFEGEYHLFHQDGGKWAHAISDDLINWKHVPVALPWNEHGHVWSGSAVADLENDSGLFTDSGGKGLIAFYTSYNPDLQNGNQKIGLAYSKDKGRTWEYSTDTPIVIENPGQSDEDLGDWDFRDPKVVRDETNDRWIMVVSGGDHIRLFTSTDLLNWEHTDNFGYGEYIRGGVWECPDLFELQVEGTNQKKWVLMVSTGANPNTEGSDAEYFIGELTSEGKFVNDNEAGDVLKTDFGKEFYASMSFANMPDDRRVALAWMTNWDYPFDFPTDGWQGQLTIPRKLQLMDTSDGIRLAQSPIVELETLRHPVFEEKDKHVTPETASDLLKKINEASYEIEMEVEIPSDSPVDEFGIQFREGIEEQTVLGYNVEDHLMFIDRSNSGVTNFSNQFTTLHEAPLFQENKRIKLNVFVDNGSIEVFVNNGEVVFTDVIFPRATSRGMSFFTEGGAVDIVSLEVFRLDDIWERLIDQESSIVTNRKELEMNSGSVQTLHADIQSNKSNEMRPIKWNSSNTDIVEIESSHYRHAKVKAKEVGEVTITASTPDGKIYQEIDVNVYDGKFNTNLTGWNADISADHWITTENGIRGSHSSDAHYMAEERAGDFLYEADMLLDKEGGAGSILFRATKDGSSGYYFNIDPNMNAFRLFYKMNGHMEERMILKKVPAFIETGKVYRVRIEANGPHIRVNVDGENIIDIKDGTFAEGHFGLHVFGGQATYQNVEINNVAEANLIETSFMNASTEQTIYVATSNNGERVIVGKDEEPTNWTLVPTGDEENSFSIRNEGNKAIDLDTEENIIQLYDYLGYDNQRWLIKDNENGTKSILSVFNSQALEVSEQEELMLQDYDPLKASQQWLLSAELN
ncbi:GH32 C-terminal domain-containing protein [Gracilibacillus sp. S3-1-1]|uniref:GH32 C-terminal domain-containing protein n=1 Tax=Gracilibacillus pellucidus TaxID=3095368 RepID=A0ACC6M3I6_9BACI|nr:GH32 C-terminal domain-containing protein [Gracilibacillus sp. S3-1-1]MDX8045524.1 GH32 C-terminal domain-containing protein [Gracilibacillus sp. S3-1-1]